MGIFNIDTFGELTEEEEYRLEAIQEEQARERDADDALQAAIDRYQWEQAEKFFIERDRPPYDPDNLPF